MAATAAPVSGQETMVYPDLRSERMDRVADRLAEALDGSLSSLARLRGSQSLTEEQAVTALAALLQMHSIQLNESLLHTLVRAYA